MWRSTSAVNASSGMNRLMSIAQMKWPVLVSLVSSALKSTTSLPNAAPLSVPASRPSIIASPAPL